MLASLLASLKWATHDISRTLVHGVNATGDVYPVGIAIGAQGDPQQVVQPAPRYQDLGKVIDGASGGAGYQVAAGAYCYSPYYSDVEWVRNLVLLVRSDSQNYDIYVIHKDAAGNESVASPLIKAQTATGSTWTLQPFTVPLALCGSNIKFALKNEGGGVANMYLCVELMG